MSEVLSRVTKFDREVGGGRLQVAALDVQALENGLFTDDPETAEIFEQAVDHRLPPAESVNRVVARDFDRTWDTDFYSSITKTYKL